MKHGWLIMVASILVISLVGCGVVNPVPPSTATSAPTSAATAIPAATQVPTLPWPTTAPLTATVMATAIPTTTQPPTLPPGTGAPKATATPVQPAAPGVHSAPPGDRFIRIRVFGDSTKWHLTGSNNGIDGPYYTPNDVLSMIDDLKPNALERFYSGALPLRQPLQYYDRSSSAMITWRDPGPAGGFPVGSIGSFLVQAMQHGAPGATIIPRLDSRNYLKNGPERFFAEAQALYQNLVDLGVPQSERFISLDNWSAIARRGGPGAADTVLSRLYSQGWQGIGIADLGQFNPSVNRTNPADSATFAVFDVDMNANWRPTSSILSQMRKETNLKLILLYIDFAHPMLEFMQLPVDQEADILQTLAQLQVYNPSDPNETGFIFVYPIAHWEWDARARITSPNGKYGGVSLYDFIRNTLLPKYNP